MPTRSERRWGLGNRAGVAMLALCLPPAVGCGEPSARELGNRREFEALLTAVSLKNKVELEKDAKRIADRHAAGELSAARHDDLQAIVAKARAGNWDDAERQAYEFREKQPYFK